MQTIINVYGSYLKLEASDEVKTKIMIQLLPEDLDAYWTRCSLTADFGASFMSFSYPDRPGVKNSLSFILNELVENAIKFTNSTTDPISISLLNIQDVIIFEVSNFINIESGDMFREFIQKYLIRDNPNNNDAYLELMNNLDKKEAASNLGLMTILNNFNVRFGFLFSTVENRQSLQSLKVTVQILINPSEI